ncbi:sigma-70 family RNA polymerase sigma factor [Geminicoccus flavidas]|uniref:sigma-70 family RNA polymerase sigma factor n=1 Tax=Geminicoccus flavidas TaxID=2506407 RepID=UPI00135C3B06|nr:sigma-70 family RNA polymerase sigma factor [Geminicoccus flavidas]
MPDIDDAELRQLLPRLRRFALSLTRDPASADDLVQASLERALSRWDTRRTEGDIRAWLFAILYRQFSDGKRRSRRFLRLLGWLAGEPEPAAASTEDLVLAKAALGALGELPDEQRALLVLIVVEGASYREAAQILGVPVGTVMSRLSRARQLLRSMVDGEAGRPRLRVVR